ncbi:MAG: hypothetical protein EHM33_13330 [Chloroflexi bacterium]|nr:MAG: hypothetical protein EHM33_13330 [Chloroflexota bacterium]
MKTNGWIAFSQRLYRRLLHLYPLKYRATYEEEMFHLFTDQCREAHTQRGWVGILVLWLRTLMDVGATVIREHLSDPRAKLGLLDAIPNAPLPWKGVLLVLIPGLIFFVSQIVQLTFLGRVWFFLAFHRAGYFLILPVLLVWLLTRRFPVWGLIPFGLLYETLWDYGRSFDLSGLPLLGRFFYQETVVLFGARINIYDLKFLLAVFVCVILSGMLMGYNARRGQISRSAWKWLGLYGLLIALQVGGEVYRRVVDLRLLAGQTKDLPAGSVALTDNISQVPLWYLYEALPFLLLVFIGMLFTRKYGGLTFLILLGYLLPTILFGRYGFWNEPVPFYVVSLAVLIYRFVVALVAPVWLVRAASVPGRQQPPFRLLSQLPAISHLTLLLV